MFKRKKKTTSPTTQRSLIAHVQPKSPISEQYRTIRTNIQFSNVDGNLHSVMVTSSSPGEGKSTTVANLAVVFAQQGKNVLLVDADMRKPTVHYTFRLENHIGLTNVLTKQAALSSAIHETSIENLSVLTSGPIPPNPAELLASAGMKEMMEEMYKEYDIVLFDTPPVLAVTDGQILANLCHGSILVIRSGETVIEAAQKSKELLMNAQGKLLGVVLNQKKQEKGEYFYYYGTN
ncbi:capsular exopolysaccharide synthesis family protein [Bacillus fengqiuensis]|nr:capsular exopolysaccharide synthesis family protein [Bacillus fengqiuensis]